MTLPQLLCVMHEHPPGQVGRITSFVEMQSHLEAEAEREAAWLSR
jgi:hypothetical protein